MSRAGQFNESRAHQRRAGRAGGFGGGGDDFHFPPPGTSFHVQSTFLYDWGSGEEITNRTRVTRFDEVMAIIGITDIFTEENGRYNFAWNGYGGGGNGNVYLGGVKDFGGGRGAEPVAYWNDNFYLANAAPNLSAIVGICGHPVKHDAMVFVAVAIGNELEVEYGLARLRRGEIRFDIENSFHLTTTVQPVLADCDDRIVYGGRGSSIGPRFYTVDPLNWDELETLWSIHTTGDSLLFLPEVQPIADQFSAIIAAPDQHRFIGGGYNYYYVPALGVAKEQRFPPMRNILLRVATPTTYPDGEYHICTGIGLCTTGTQRADILLANAGGK